MHFQICPQIVCLKGLIITLAAFVRLFPNMCFQMSTQRSWIRASKLTLVAFFLLFASVRLRINPQMACMRRCIVLVKHWIPMLSISSERQRFYQSVRDLKQVSAISSWASEILRSVRDMYSRKKRAAKKLSLQSARTGSGCGVDFKVISGIEGLTNTSKQTNWTIKIRALKELVWTIPENFFFSRHTRFQSL